jgi:hypothetical protein
MDACVGAPHLSRNLKPTVTIRDWSPQNMTRVRFARKVQAAAAAKAHAVEAEAAPIMYVAQLLGGTTEQAIRWLILAMVLCCDPLAIALTAAASARRC